MNELEMTGHKRHRIHKRTLRTPYLTVDAIIEVDGGVVLIERKHPPPGWALPGGYVEYGEWVEHAVVREAKEETGLDIQLTELFHVYSDPARDARRHNVAVVFIGRAWGEPVGGDDAATARVFGTDRIPFDRLAFDHPRILRDYLRYRREGIRPGLSPRTMADKVDYPKRPPSPTGMKPAAPHRHYRSSLRAGFRLEPTLEKPCPVRFV